MQFLALCLLIPTPTKVEAQIQDLRQAYTQLTPAQRENIFIQEPIVSPPFKAGVLSKDSIAAGLDAINFARRIANLPHDVSDDPILNLRAQHGAVLSLQSPNLSHRPQKPPNMPEDFYTLGGQGTSQGNLSRVIGAETDITVGVRGQLLDDGPNSWAVGHRRWLLNPNLQKVGIGQASKSGPTTDIVIVVFDRSRPTPEYDFVAWPSQTAFPIDYCLPTIPWSVSLNPKKYQPPQPGEVTVTMTESTSNETQTFSPKPSPKTWSSDGFYSVIDLNGFGIPNAIIFRPDPLPNYQPGQVWKVTIEGIKTKDGKPTVLTYSTTLFELSPKQSNS